ncbi:MAG: response regulator [Rhodospirillaceae bacterium]
MSSSTPQSRKLRVLLVEDSPDDAELVLCELAAAGFDVESKRTETAEETLAALRDNEWDIVLSDYNLPVFSGPEALETLQQTGKDIPFIIVSGCVGDEAAVSMMKAGAEDFVIKGSLARLAPAVNRALLEAQTRRRYRSTQEELHRNEAQLRALASNIPGMVFQLQLDGTQLRFTFVSDGALALFEVAPKALLESAYRLLDLIVEEDRTSYLRALDVSASQLGTLDWQGRIQVGPNAALKWIAIKAGPRVGDDNTILWDGITTEITAAKVAEQRIRASEEEFRRLSAHVETVKEKERARIAREIHDDLGGTLTAIKIDLMSLANRLPSQADALKEKVASVDRLVDVAIQSTVRIAADLRPGALDCGIVAAVQWQARDFARRTGIRCTVHTKEEDISLPTDPSLALFRIFQEALTNVAKHSHATAVDIRLERTANWFTLQVRDNGCGIAEADRHKAASFGIRGMLERTRDLGGQVEISGSDGQGTTVSVRVPLATPEMDGELEHQFRLL